MPAVPKTSDKEILAVARGFIEAGDLHFSMASVAAKVGIRPPSLYKRFATREVLITEVRCEAYQALAALLLGTVKAGTALESLRAMAVAYRSFALQHPYLYALFFMADEANHAATQEARASAVVPALQILRDLLGTQHALSAARAFTAFLHGHISMVLSDAFKLGDDVEEAFDYGVNLLLDGMTAKRRDLQM